jgi:chemotaxis signal transduction protein
MTEERTRKVLIFPARPAEVGPVEGPLLFLFSMGQVADIMKTAVIHPVPFSPPHIEGIACWRKGVLPVFSPEGCLSGGKGDDKRGKEGQGGKEERFVVVRGPGGGRQPAGAIFRARGAVELLSLPGGTAPASTPRWITRPDRVRGVYAWGERYLIVLDIVSILRDNGRD